MGDMLQEVPAGHKDQDLARILSCLPGWSEESHPTTLTVSFLPSNWDHHFQLESLAGTLGDNTTKVSTNRNLLLCARCPHGLQWHTHEAM